QVEFRRQRLMTTLVSIVHPLLFRYNTMRNFICNLFLTMRRLQYGAQKTTAADPINSNFRWTSGFPRTLQGGDFKPAWRIRFHFRCREDPARIGEGRPPRFPAGGGRAPAIPYRV